MDISVIKDFADSVTANISKVIVGKDNVA